MQATKRKVPVKMCEIADTGVSVSVCVSANAPAPVDAWQPLIVKHLQLEVAQEPDATSLAARDRTRDTQAERHTTQGGRVTHKLSACTDVARTIAPSQTCPSRSPSARGGPSVWPHSTHASLPWVRREVGITEPTRTSCSDRRRSGCERAGTRPAPKSAAPWSHGPSCK